MALETAISVPFLRIHIDSERTHYGPLVEHRRGSSRGSKWIAPLFASGGCCEGGQWPPPCWFHNLQIEALYNARNRRKSITKAQAVLQPQ